MSCVDLLYKEFYIKEHRRKWKWIARYVKKVKDFREIEHPVFPITMANIENEYVHTKELDPRSALSHRVIKNNEYLCHYTSACGVYRVKLERCEKYCPLDWRDDVTIDPNESEDSKKYVPCVRENHLNRVFTFGVELPDGTKSKYMRDIIKVLGKDKVVEMCYRIANLKERKIK